MGPRVSLALNIKASQQSGYVDLSWASTVGEFFNVEYAFDPVAAFTTVVTNVEATAPMNFVTIPVTNKVGFYRLRF
ncbi:MAG TPA: hypothetical protein VL361_15130 [Candidatus Limnocylindrales bacterium]|jgi:hypothetical protein|nr:hypothetical protein [Candidatus Limnocylindrales bacterium]